MFGANHAVPLDRLEPGPHRRAWGGPRRSGNGRAVVQPPFPIKIEEDKWLVVGRGRGGRFLQVIYVVDPDKTVFIIHARPISEREKRRLRRRGKS